jgi:hypothetical protein
VLTTPLQRCFSTKGAVPPEPIVRRWALALRPTVCHERRRRLDAEDQSLDVVLCRRWRSRVWLAWWPSVVAVQAEAANLPELLRSRAVVVSVAEKSAVSAAGVDHEGERKRYHS